MVELEHRETRLKLALDRITDQYTSCCSTARRVELLTLNGLVAADAVVIPMQCEYYALEGLSDLVNTIRKVKQGLNPALYIEGSCAPCSTAQPAFAAGLGAARAAFRRQGVSDHHSTQRPPR